MFLKGKQIKMLQLYSVLIDLEEKSKELTSRAMVSETVPFTVT